MTDKLKQKMTEEIAGLSKENQDAINSFDWAGISENIAKKYFYTDNEINYVQLGVGIVLLGLGDLDWYARYIESEIGTSKDEANKIAEEALDKIFTPIANKIEEVVKKNEKDKDHKWDKNLDFILSGGDYSTLVAKAPEPEEPKKSESPIKPSPPPTKPITSSSIEDIRKKFTI